MIHEQRDKHGWTKSERENNLSLAIELLKKAKDFSVTTQKKCEHGYNKYMELKEFYYACMEVNKYLFDPDYNFEFYRYKQAINLKDKKSNLDLYLYNCKRFLCKELSLTINMHEENLFGKITF